MINKDLYWNSWGTNYAYAEFDAKVIITASKQDEGIQAKVRTELKKRQEVVVKQPTFREKIEREQEETFTLLNFDGFFVVNVHR